MSIRVLVVDDHFLLRQALRRLLELEPEIEVVGEASRADEAEQLVDVLSPEIVLLDLEMPGRNGIEVAASITERHPRIGIIILTMHDADDYLQQSLNAGVQGYLLKTCGIQEVINAIKTVNAGKSIIDPSMTMQMLAQFRRLTHRAAEESKPSGLTDREIDLLKLLARGMNNKSIAATLAYSESTVKNRLSTIFDKMGVSDRTQAVIEAMRLGLLKVNEPDVEQSA